MPPEVILGREDIHATFTSFRHFVFGITSNIQHMLYRVTLVVANLGWDDLILNVPPSCRVDQPILPNSHLPKQYQAVRGMSKFTVNPTKPRYAPTRVSLYYILSHIT